MLRTIRKRQLLSVLAAFCCMAGMAGMAKAAETVQEWEVLAPAGEIERPSIDPAPRITTLEGKTVVLRWNGKNNGNIFLDRFAELMAKKYPNTKLIKSYNDSKNGTLFNTITGNQKQSMFVTESIAAMKPDLVIAAQAD